MSYTYLQRPLDLGRGESGAHEVVTSCIKFWRQHRVATVRAVLIHTGAASALPAA